MPETMLPAMTTPTPTQQAEALWIRAHEHVRQGDLANAVRDLARCFKLLQQLGDPRLPEVHRRWTEVHKLALEDVAHQKQAAAARQPVVAQQPTLEAEAEAAANTGDLEKAIALLEQALAARPDNELVRERLSELRNARARARELSGAVAARGPVETVETVETARPRPATTTPDTVAEAATEHAVVADAAAEHAVVAQTADAAAPAEAAVDAEPSHTVDVEPTSGPVGAWVDTVDVDLTSGPVGAAPGPADIHAAATLVPGPGEVTGASVDVAVSAADPTDGVAAKDVEATVSVTEAPLQPVDAAVVTTSIELGGEVPVGEPALGLADAGPDGPPLDLAGDTPLPAAPVDEPAAIEPALELETARVDVTVGGPTATFAVEQELQPGPTVDLALESGVDGALEAAARDAAMEVGAVAPGVESLGVEALGVGVGAAPPMAAEDAPVGMASLDVQIDMGGVVSAYEADALPVSADDTIIVDDAMEVEEIVSLTPQPTAGPTPPSTTGDDLPADPIALLETLLTRVQLNRRAA